MTPFTTLTSALVPLPLANIDTDQVIPAQFVNVQGQAALARALFANLRTDPAFILNQPGMLGRQVLLVGRNFGCGSSREAAAWALGAAGFRALVGPSFNTTFWNNCIANGMLPISVAEPVWRKLVDAVAADPQLTVHIDLPARRVQAGAITSDIDIDPFAHELLVRGLDELDYLLERLPAIQAFEAAQAASA